MCSATAARPRPKEPRAEGVTRRRSHPISITRNIPWARVLAEGVVIAVSILLAFGIDAWWDGTQEKAREQDALERLDAEFAVVDSVLRQWQAGQESVAAATEVLLAHTGPEGSAALESDSIAALIWTLSIPWSFDPPNAVLLALESSGQLAAFQNQDLVAQIGSWRALVADLQSDEAGGVRALSEGFRPFLMSRVALRAVSSQGFAWDAGAFPGGFQDLMGSREFENHVDNRRVGAMIVVGDYEKVRTRLTVIRTLIWKELEN